MKIIPNRYSDDVVKILEAIDYWIELKHISENFA